jgi:GTPase SAR1 family protein
MSARPTVEASQDERGAIGHLIVVAGPPAVGKSLLIRRMAGDDLLRERLTVPKGAAALLPRDVMSRVAENVEALILHYDLLRLLDRGIPAYGSDPSLSLLDSAQRITFLTLRTTAERLRAQLEQKRIARPNRPPDRQAHHRMLRKLYEDDGFVHSWYDLWLEFAARYEAVTIGHFFVEVHEGYALTPVIRAAPTSASLSRAAAARPT